MPEDLNAEIAAGLAEASDEQAERERVRWERLVEILEACVLAVVAVATAWSGYQAARWDGRQAELYAMASTQRVEADQALTLGGQQRLLDVTTFNTWIQCRRRGDTVLRRSTSAGSARNSRSRSTRGSPPIRSRTPTCRRARVSCPSTSIRRSNTATALNEQANATFEAGTAARSTADQYIRTTVVLASVLFLLALSQRFRLRQVRIGVLVVAGALMLYGIAAIISFERL